MVEKMTRKIYVRKGNSRWCQRIYEAIREGKNLERHGVYIVNMIGVTCYIAYHLLNEKELEYLVKMKKEFI